MWRRNSAHARGIRASIEGMKRGTNTTFQFASLMSAVLACFSVGLCGCLSASMNSSTSSQNTQNKNAQNAARVDSAKAGDQACGAASRAWLALPAEYKTLAGSSGFVADGPGALDTADGWNAWTTQGEGSLMSFTITTAQAGDIYAWPLMDDASSATYSYALDGVITGMASVQPSQHMATQNGTTRSLGFLHWENVPAGTHTITFTQTSSGTSGVSVVGIGSSAVSASGQPSIVL